MARKVEVVLIDDIDGSQAQRTITFSVDGQNYEIDLNEKNAARFDAAMQEFVDAARPVRGKTRTARSSSRVGGVSPADVRAWAEANGVKVSARGRIPREVMDAYEAAN